LLTIHSLPERMAHKSKKIQLDLIAVLCLLALLLHEHIFWFAALILAFIDIPDFSTPVCTENLNPGIVVMKAAEDRGRFDAPGALNRARDWRVSVQ
jgi:hypothetical protein